MKMHVTNVMNKNGNFIIVLRVLRSKEILLLFYVFYVQRKYHFIFCINIYFMQNEEVGSQQFCVAVKQNLRPQNDTIYACKSFNHKRAIP